MALRHRRRSAEPERLAVLVLGAAGAVSFGGFSGSAPSSTFVYGALIPAVLRVCLVARPLLGGMMFDSGSTALRWARGLAALTVVGLVLRTLPSLEIALLGGWTSALVQRGHWAFRLTLAALMVWPAAYGMFWRESPARYSWGSLKGEP